MFLHLIPYGEFIIGGIGLWHISLSWVANMNKGLFIIWSTKPQNFTNSHTWSQLGTAISCFLLSHQLVVALTSPEIRNTEHNTKLA